MKYTKKQYLKYVKGIKRDAKKPEYKGIKPISFKDWKIFQPIADKVVGKVNKIINSQKI